MEALSCLTIPSSARWCSESHTRSNTSGTVQRFAKLLCFIHSFLTLTAKTLKVYSTTICIYVDEQLNLHPTILRASVSGKNQRRFDRSEVRSVTNESHREVFAENRNLYLTHTSYWSLHRELEHKRGNGVSVRETTHQRETMKSWAVSAREQRPESGGANSCD